MNNPSKPARRFDLPHLLSIFTKPRQTFTELKTGERAAWLTPMLVLTVSAILVVLVSGFMLSRAASSGAVELPPDWEFWTPEMQDNFLQAQQATQGPMFTYILPLLGSLSSLWVGWFVFSGILHLISTILGGRGSMRGALTVVAWASLPYLIRDLLRDPVHIVCRFRHCQPGAFRVCGRIGFSLEPAGTHRSVPPVACPFVGNRRCYLRGIAARQGICRRGIHCPRRPFDSGGYRGARIKFRFIGGFAPVFLT